MAELRDRAQHRWVLIRWSFGQTRAPSREREHDRHHCDTDPRHAPRRAESKRDTGHCRADHRSAVEQPMEAHEVRGLSGEGVRRDDVHHDVDGATGSHGEDERGREDSEVGCRSRNCEQSSPQEQRAQERECRTPAVDDETADGRDRGGREDASRENEPDLRVREAERALDVDNGDGPAAREGAEDEKGRGNRSHRDAHTTVSRRPSAMP